MFSKLKNFSEDVAKSLTELNQGDSANVKVNPVRELKNARGVLGRATPDVGDMKEPEDEPETKELESDGTPSADPIGSSTPEADDKPATGKPVSSTRPVPNKQINTSASGTVSETLPPYIQSKMKKFAKYEEKYPILLEAYKTEKRKAELVILFEKVLQENTPVSSIADAGALVEYLNGLNEKTTMLTTEMRRYAGENTRLTKEVRDLSAKLKEKEKEQATEFALLKEQLDSSKAETTRLQEEKSKSPENDDTSEKLLESEKKVATLEKEMASINEKLAGIEKENATLKASTDSTDLHEENNSIKEKLSIAELELKQARLSASELKEKLIVMENELNKEKEIIDSFKAEVPQKEEVPSQATKSKGKNKKKKNKNAEPDTANDDLTKAIAEKDKLAHEVKEVTVKYDAALKANEELLERNKSLKEKLENQSEDLENVRELLKDVGNYLVEARDEIKELKSTKSSTDELNSLEKLKSELETSLKEKTALVSQLQEGETDYKSQLAKSTEAQKASKIQQDRYKSENKSLVEKNAVLTKDVERISKEVEALKKDKDDFNKRINELTKFKSNDTSLRLEIASIKTSLGHKDQQIQDYKKRVEELTNRKDELNETISKLKMSNHDLQNSNKSLLSTKSELITNQELAAERTNSLTNELSKLQSDRQKSLTELELLKSKYDQITKEKSNSKDEMQSYKQQFEELSMKSKESSMRLENLEDELAEARVMLQERTREATTIRRLLVDVEGQLKSKETEHKNEIKRINEDKQDTESHFQAQAKRKQRDIDELKSITDNYLLKIQDLEKKLSELQNQKVVTPVEVDDSNGFQQTIDALRKSLQESSKKLKEYQSMINSLKKLNEESNLKFERLSKNYKILTQQYREMKSLSDVLSNTTAANSPRVSMDQTPETAENSEHIAYLKNVLLGFFDHKEQREQLLPVVKTLFNLSSDDEKRFLHALK